MSDLRGLVCALLHTVLPFVAREEFDIRRPGTRLGDLTAEVLQELLKGREVPAAHLPALS